MLASKDVRMRKMSYTLKDLLKIRRDLVRGLRKLRFSPPVAHVYNPLEYAWAAHRRYLELYGEGTREVLLVGMNPGPWGMAQTGVPFGAISRVRDWLRIEEEVERPPGEHPKRPVEGFACVREEVSGARLWGWAEEIFATPERFFERFFVTNYCPLLFLEEGARNLTPDKIPAEEREPLLEICDRALAREIEYFAPRLVLGVGAFAEKRIRAATAGLDLEVEIGRILHPSPASPKANRGWAEIATRELRELGVELP